MHDKDPDSTGYLLGQLCRLHHARIRTEFQALGLYRGQPPLLSTLHDEEGQTQSELAERLHVTRATMTKMLQRMQKAGWISRRPDEHDQRAMRVYLTDAGRAVRGEMHAILDRLDQETLDGFTMEERVLFRRLLLLARDNLRRYNEEA